MIIKYWISILFLFGRQWRWNVLSTEWPVTQSVLQLSTLHVIIFLIQIYIYFVAYFYITFCTMILLSFKICLNGCFIFLCDKYKRYAKKEIYIFFFSITDNDVWTFWGGWEGGIEQWIPSSFVRYLCFMNGDWVTIKQNMHRNQFTINAIEMKIGILFLSILRRGKKSEHL